MFIEVERLGSNRNEGQLDQAREGRHDDCGQKVRCSVSWKTQNFICMHRAGVQAIAGELVVARRWDQTSAITSVDKQKVYHFQSSLLWDVERYLSYEIA